MRIKARLQYCIIHERVCQVLYDLFVFPLLLKFKIEFMYVHVIV